MEVIRVFPQETAFTPDDDYCFYDSPGLFIPKHDEIHILCIYMGYTAGVEVTEGLASSDESTSQDWWACF